MRVIKNI